MLVLFLVYVFFFSISSLVSFLFLGLALWVLGWVFMKISSFLNVLILMEVGASLLLISLMLGLWVSVGYVFSVLTFLVCESTMGLSILVSHSRSYSSYSAYI